MRQHQTHFAPGARTMTEHDESCDGASPGLRQALETVWRQRRVATNPYREPAYADLVALCDQIYPGAGGRQMIEFSLHQALARLGLGNVRGESAPDHVADRVHEAFTQVLSKRIHLCPLDLAGDMPALKFGPNQIRDFTKTEFDALIASMPLDPYFKSRLDTQRLAQVSWLVVEERVALPGAVGARALPFLFMDFSKDLGGIEPHKPRFPSSVEDALFFLLTAPWEDLVQYRLHEWRPFRIPWVLTLNDDLFARSVPVPDPDALTWEPYSVRDRDGLEIEEIEVPVRTYLDDDAPQHLTYLDDAGWARFQAARATPAMAGPIAHFLVRAFAADDIDEFLHHVTTIEACLGSSDDHTPGHKPLPDKSRGATGRTAWRLSTLLNDETAGPGFKALFKARSQFVHGEQMGDISGKSRRAARALARRCVLALAGAAPHWQDRAELLRSLVDYRPEPSSQAERGAGPAQTTGPKG